jgi:hypothetical protein
MEATKRVGKMVTRLIGTLVVLGREPAVMTVMTELFSGFQLQNFKKKTLLLLLQSSFTNHQAVPRNLS